MNLDEIITERLFELYAEFNATNKENKARAYVTLYDMYYPYLSNTQDVKPIDMMYVDIKEKLVSKYVR